MSELRQNTPTKENLTTIMQASKMYAKELDFDKAFAEIAKLREHARKKSKTFADGLVFAVLETMYNYIGYIRK
jgi:hypothetical protein